ncbi:MAG: acetylornithine deacetylase [Myxococcota bacterium]
MSAFKSTLAELVSIDSTSVRSNAALIDLVESRLRRAGFDCQRQRYQDEAGVEKVNLLAKKGEGLPELALVGHSDCVPFDAAWKEALVLTEKDGRWYGRGACDTKAYLACALHAAERAVPKKALLLVFTADEELGCVGAKHLVEAGLGRARHAIVGEPTSLTPIRANKGYCLAEVEVHGKEGHSAYPESGASAIFRAARFLRRLEERALSDFRAERDEAFEPPYGTMNVGVVSGGRAKNVIPGRCSFTVEWRPLPKQSVEKGRQLLDDVAAEMRETDPGFSCTVRVLRMDRGVDTPASAEVVRFLSEKTGKAPATVAFGTEAPQLTALGAQAVVFGPGDIRVAHQSGEHVPIAEVEACERILAEAIAHFCG